MEAKANLFLMEKDDEVWIDELDDYDNLQNKYKCLFNDFENLSHKCKGFKNIIATLSLGLN